ncbi:MAG: cupredoxin domain-containing protein [bacterium]|nr:cupredoxin domain-containing protein [bacterium]
MYRTRVLLLGIAVGVLLMGAGCGARDAAPTAPAPAPTFIEPELPPLPDASSAPIAPPTPADAVPTTPLPLPVEQPGNATAPPRAVDAPPLPLPPEAEAPAPRTIAITAKQWEFVPSTIRLTRGEPVVLEVTSIDVDHGFSAPDLGINEHLSPGGIARIAITPQKIGTFPMSCNIFCGAGHGTMRGSIVVE